MMTRPSTLLLLHAARALLGLRSSRPKTLRQVSTLESPMALSAVGNMAKGGRAHLFPLFAREVFLTTVRYEVLV